MAILPCFLLRLHSQRLGYVRAWKNFPTEVGQISAPYKISPARLDLRGAPPSCPPTMWMYSRHMPYARRTQACRAALAYSRRRSDCEEAAASRAKRWTEAHWSSRRLQVISATERRKLRWHVPSNSLPTQLILMACSMAKVFGAPRTTSAAQSCRHCFVGGDLRILFSTSAFLSILVLFLLETFQHVIIFLLFDLLIDDKSRRI